MAPPSPATVPPTPAQPEQPLQSFGLTPDPAVFATPAGVPDTGFQLKPEATPGAGDVYAGPDPGDVYAGPDSGDVYSGPDPGDVYAGPGAAGAGAHAGYVNPATESDDSPVMAVSPGAPLSWRDVFYYPVRGDSQRVVLVGGAMLIACVFAVALIGEMAALVLVYGLAWITVAVLRSGAAGELALTYLPSPFDFYLRFRDVLTVLFGGLINAGIELALFYAFDPLESTIRQGDFALLAVLLVLRFLGLFLSMIAVAAAAIYDQPFLAFRIDKHLRVVATAWLDLLKMFGALIAAILLIIGIVFGVNLILPAALPDIGGLPISMIAAVFAPIFIIMYLMVFLNFSMATVFRRHKSKIDDLYFYL